MFQSDRPKGEQPRRTSDSNATVSIVAHGARCVGDIECTGILRIEGRLEGSVRSTEQALVTREGFLLGDVEAGIVLVAGTIRGNVTASERVELQPGANVEGDITAPRVVVADGSTFNGRLTMRAAVASSASPASARAPRPMLATA